MKTWLVGGIIQFCIYSQWNEIAISEETTAANADAAKRAVLARHTQLAERQDPYATVRWHTPEWVQARHVPAHE